MVENRSSYNYKYDVALSFSGKDREIARKIAQALQEKGVKVFYDEWAKADLWGKELFSHLHEIYLRQARFCLPLFSRNYTESKWTKHELKSAQERSLETEEDYLLPIRIDDTPVPGLLSTIDYLEYSNHTPETIAELVEQKLQSEPRPGRVQPIPSAEKLEVVPTQVTGFSRQVVGRDVRISDDDIIRTIEDISADSNAKVRYSFARELGRYSAFKFDLSYRGPIYTAWRIKNSVFLSVLPGVIYGDQKTFEFELYGGTKKKLALVAEWAPVESGWGPMGFDEYHKCVAGLSADRSGCDMFRESTVRVLLERGNAFRFPVAPRAGAPEQFCGWVQQEPTSLLYDWDRNPQIVRPGFGIWEGIYDDQTGEGILLFILQGGWSNSSLYTFEDTLDLFLPRRYIRTGLRPGVARICVHLSNTPPRLSTQTSAHKFDVDYVEPTLKRVYAAIARIIAAEREIALTPAGPNAGLPELDSYQYYLFEEAVVSLGSSECPDIKDYSTDSGTSRWSKLHHSPDSFRLGVFRSILPFSFANVVTESEIISFIESYEGSF